ncbi:MAG: trigger factor [Lachnospiraceae bacterium]|nr:trigger factor [Lachnospiraceae bacterium]
MKKRMIGFMAVLLTAGLLTGCGEKEEGTLLKDINVDKYVTLGEYKGLPVSVAFQQVDEEEAVSLANEAYSSAVTAELGGITDRAVAVGDTVIMDYEGKRDGVAFDGGTAQGADLTIGSGRFIDGFEDGLIGVMPGETVELNLTFPEDYFNEELAGAEVVFTVTVHYILPGIDDMTEDAVVAALGIEDVDTVDGLIAYAKEYLNNQVESYNQSNLENAVMAAFMEQCEFDKLPQNLLEEYQKLIRENLELEAQQYSSYTGYEFDAETYAQQAYGYESLEAFVTENAESATKQGLALQAVANRENLNLDDEALDARILEYAQEAGYDTIEEFIGDTSKEDFREYFLNEDVLQFLIDNADVTESAAES